MFLWMKLWLLRYFWRPKPKHASRQESLPAVPKQSWYERLQVWRHKRHNCKLIDSANAGKLWQVEQLILREGADVNCLGRDGLTPLLVAIDQRQADTVKLLMDLGASAVAVENGKSRYRNKGPDTNDPLWRAMLSEGLPAEPIQAIIRRSTNLKRLKKARRLLKQNPFGDQVERAELIEMAIEKRIGQLQALAEPRPVSNVTPLTANTLPKL
jgi:hypothetical protein